MHICVICSVWNARNWIGRCIDSIQQQTYTDFRCAIVDDCSDDDTYDIIRERTQNDDRFIVKRNPSNVCSIANHLAAVELVAGQPQDVLVIVDGDDWLRHPRVFEHLSQVYASDDVWLTYGSYQLWRNRRSERLGIRCERGHVEPYPDDITTHNLFRYYPFMASHLRSFRRFLWDRIDPTDLKDEDGSYIRSSRDFAAMIPMLEMSGPRHIRYIHELLYVYNHKNPRGIRHRHRGEQQLNELKIRAKLRYWPIAG